MLNNPPTVKKKSKYIYPKDDELLRQSEKKYRTLFYNANDAIFLMLVTEDKMPGRIVEVNDAACRRLGYTKEEFLSMTPAQIDDPVLFKKIPEEMKKIFHSGQYTFETIHIGKDGTRWPVEISAHLILLNGVTVIQAIARDISKRKQTEEALKRRVEFEELVTSISTSFINLASDEIDNGIDRALKSICEFVGADRSFVMLFSQNGNRIDKTYEWCKQGFWNKIGFYRGLNVDVFPWTIQKLKQMEKVSVPLVAELPKEAELDKAQADLLEIKSYVFVPMLCGRYLMGLVGFTVERTEKNWSEETIVLLNMVGEIFANALERKRSEEVLRLSEERFFKAFNASPGMMAISAYSDGRVVNVNKAFLRIFGPSTEKVVGKTTVELRMWLSPEERDKMVRRIDERGFVHNLEIKFRSSTGELRTGLYSGEKLELHREQCILSTINDITELKELEQEISKLDRLNLVGEMAASIAHEIRNPLTTVHGFLQLLRDKKEYASDKESFDIMIEELLRANSIITEYLSLAKNKIIDVKMQSLNAIVKVLSPMLCADANITGKNIVMDLGTVPDLMLDEKEIRQLILNLVRNGLEAMAPGKTLTIKTYMKNGCAVLCVQDQGKGIPPNEINRIGEPFFTTKEHGTGLGLPVCFSIAARHNAEIEFKTGPTGTSFFVKFALNCNML